MTFGGYVFVNLTFTGYVSAVLTIGSYVSWNRNPTKVVFSFVYNLNQKFSLKTWFFLEINVKISTIQNRFFFCWITVKKIITFLLQKLCWKIVCKKNALFWHFYQFITTFKYVIDFFDKNYRQFLKNQDSFKNLISRRMQISLQTFGHSR